ncbi:hypothetical protein NM688_g4681 [Phlebia brevispora]|uniref:Uncharacterized protein n=1 Tax=Phlebia brevispora TaxID=194682 RepID=A0ACC1T1Z0_9APHY|nr:hypothetical protein NM688_g4681 [Phlebia brevispora]
MQRHAEFSDKIREAIRSSFGDGLKSMFYITIVATAPAKQRRGYASTLMRIACATADETTCVTWLVLGNVCMNSAFNLPSDLPLLCVFCWAKMTLNGRRSPYLWTYDKGGTIISTEGEGSDGLMFDASRGSCILYLRGVMAFQQDLTTYGAIIYQTSMVRFAKPHSRHELVRGKPDCSESKTNARKLNARPRPSNRPCAPNRIAACRSGILGLGGWVARSLHRFEEQVLHRSEPHRFEEQVLPSGPSAQSTARLAALTGRWNKPRGCAQAALKQESREVVIAHIFSVGGA